MNLKMFNFTLKINILDFSEDIADILYEVGCDDALLHSDAIGIYLDFCRESESLEKAIASAIADVKKAGFNIIYN